jgi:hypothetical protein
MELVLNRYVTSVVIIITVPVTLFLSCLLLLSPLAASTIISLTVFTSPWYDVFGKIKKHPLPKYDMFPEVPFWLGAGQKSLLDYSGLSTIQNEDSSFLSNKWPPPLEAQVAILFEYNVLFSARSHTTLTLSFSGQVKSPNSVHPRQHTSAYVSIHRTCLGKRSLQAVCILQTVVLVRNHTGEVL